MEWMVIAHVRLNRQTSEAYALAFKKIFAKCSSYNQRFLPGSTLIGILTDWSDAETNGLRQAVGKTVAENLLRGCSVHWNCFCQRVADRVAKRKEEKSIYLKVCYTIPKLTTAVEVVAYFEALCGVRSLNELSKKVQTLKLTKEEIESIHKKCDWSIAKHWAQWWARCEHLKMLTEVFTSMDITIWRKCPTTANAVERKNKDCKCDNPGNLKLAMMKVYKLDKVASLKHIAAEQNISLPIIPIVKKHGWQMHEANKSRGRRYWLLTKLHSMDHRTNCQILLLQNALKVSPLPQMVTLHLQLNLQERGKWHQTSQVLLKKEEHSRWAIPL